MEQNPRAWPALWALCLGFFIILVDSTIVSVATPAIMTDLNADVNAVMWVTSAYLLAYAVPLLVTGRLGDRFGPKNLYLLGLAVFTAASIWCGLADGITMLIVARVFQGFGAALITPQTMAIITRVFPPDKRGTAMGVWGAVAGAATLVGPLMGGVLVDSLGWEWIFFVNVPVGIVAFVLAVRLVPALPTSSHKFDMLGVVLSAAGLFLLVFGIQEGESYDWGTPVWVLIGLGMLVFGLFLWWQARNRSEPLLPLGLFRDRNFSLANVGITSMGFAITALIFPLMLYAQTVRGFTPTQAALLMVPMAVVTGVLAPVVGKLVDRVHPRYIAAPGLALLSVSLLWLAAIMTPETAVWQLLLPVILMGVANACVWSPLAATATRNLPLHQAGAGAGVYNTTRQMGAVLGSAGITAVMVSRLSVQGIASTGGPELGAANGPLPEVVKTGFTTAMAESMLLPAVVLLIGCVAVMFFERPIRHVAPAPAAAV